METWSTKRRSSPNRPKFWAKSLVEINDTEVLFPKSLHDSTLLGFYTCLLGHPYFLQKASTLENLTTPCSHEAKRKEGQRPKKNQAAKRIKCNHSTKQSVEMHQCKLPADFFSVSALVLRFSLLSASDL